MTHIKEEHLGIKLNPIEGNKKVKCPECKRVVSKKGLKRHIQRDCPKTGVKTTSKRPAYSCNDCNFTTTNQVILQKHKKNSHEGESLFKKASKYCQILDEDKFKCTSCHKSFSQKRNCIGHIQVQHLGKNESSKEIIKCYVCKKSVSKKSLKRHMLVHSEENQYPCETCDIYFTRKDGLARHHKNIHK